MISYGAVGTAGYSVASGTSVSAAYPAGVAAGNMLVLIVGQKPTTANGGTVGTPAGWTLVGSHLGQGGYGSTIGADTGNTNLFVFTMVAVGGETGSVVVSLGDNNASWAVILRFTTTSTGWNNAAMAVGSVDSTPISPITVTTSTLDMQAGDFLVYALVFSTDAVPTWTDSPSISSPNAFFPPTGNPVLALTTGNGNNIGGNIGYGTDVRNGASAGPVTWVRPTSTSPLTNHRGPFAVIRLRENPPVIPSTSYTVPAVEAIAAYPSPLSPAVQELRAVEAIAAYPSPLSPAVQNMTAVEATAANPSPLGAAVQNMTAIEMTVAWRVEDIPQNDCWVWDGSQEIPASVFVWDGTIEVPTTLEVT